MNSTEKFAICLREIPPRGDSLGTAQAAEWVVEGKVVGVSDGDTITVLDDGKTEHKIRFAGIDAPEKGQAFGERSKQSLSALVFQKRVELRCYKKSNFKST